MNKPKTPTEWAAYRATLSCDLGIQTLEGGRKPPDGTSRQDYALYCLLHAVRSLAEIHFNPNTKP
jgi:hypothetical protein